MPKLDPNKCYAQQPKRLIITRSEQLRADWQSDFYERLAVQLNLNNTDKREYFDYQTNIEMLTEKEFFFRELEVHLGEASTFSSKPQLLESFGMLYAIFIHPSTSVYKKHLIASRIAEDVHECSPGFTNRVNTIIILCNMPQNLDELMAQARFKLVDRLASIIVAQNPQGIHVHNRVIEVARGAGFGIWFINENDVHFSVGSQDLSDNAIKENVQTGFANHFQLFGLLNALCMELEALMADLGYLGKLESENGYKKQEYDAFVECIKLFIPIPMENLLEVDAMSDKVTNINWQNVKRAYLQKLRDENYVNFSQEEIALLDGLLHDAPLLDTATLTTLIPHGYELVQCLEFFSEWSIEQKAGLVRAYLNDNAQKEILAILHNEAPQLTAQLKKDPRLQAIYFAIAIGEKDVASVGTYIEQGEDINAALSLLFSQKHKRDTLFWLHDNPHLLQKMTVASMNTVIAEGKYQGKTIAETLVSTKKGRQLLWENEALQTLLAQTTLANRLSDSLKQAQIERSTVSTREGFFKKSSPLAIQLVQLIVYGDLRKSEALLQAAQANPSLLETLLTEKVTVIDYSRRKVKQKTAFQAALCAMDDELCAMLAKYMPKEEMTRQYQEIFPEGHETYYKAQTPFDFSQIVQIITQSNNRDVEKALSLELPNDTVLWGNLERFRADFTKHSSQETVFNPQHLIKAFELYGSQFGDWSWFKRDLFWRQVVGFVERFLPANSAMDFAQGLYNRVENKEEPSRSFNFRYGGGAIFPLSFDSFSGLGYECGAGCGARQTREVARGGAAVFFQNLCRAKTAILGELCSQSRPATIQAV